MGDNWEDSYLTYNTTGGVDDLGGSSSSRKLRPSRSLPAMSRTNFYIMLKDKLER